MDEMLNVLYQRCVDENTKLLHDREYLLLARQSKREEECAKSLVTSAEWGSLNRYFDAMTVQEGRLNFLCFREGYRMGIRMIRVALID